MQLYTFAGEIDMEIAIASFRKSLPQWCCPSLQSDGAISVEKILWQMQSRMILS